MFITIYIYIFFFTAVKRMIACGWKSTTSECGGLTHLVQRDGAAVAVWERETGTDKNLIDWVDFLP